MIRIGNIATSSNLDDDTREEIMNQGEEEIFDFNNTIQFENMYITPIKVPSMFQINNKNQINSIGKILSNKFNTSSPTITIGILRPNIPKLFKWLDEDLSYYAPSKFEELGKLKFKRQFGTIICARVPMCKKIKIYNPTNGDEIEQELSYDEYYLYFKINQHTTIYWYTSNGEFKKVDIEFLSMFQDNKLYTSFEYDINIIQTSTPDKKIWIQLKITKIIIADKKIKELSDLTGLTPFQIKLS